MCPRWAESFEAFLEDVGPRPGRGYSLDRVDVAGNYEPGNCRWADTATQARNKQITRFYAFEGSIGILADWAEFFGTTRGRLRSLLRRGLAPLQPVNRSAVDPWRLTERPRLDLNDPELLRPIEHLACEDAP